MELNETYVFTKKQVFLQKQNYVILSFEKIFKVNITERIRKFDHKNLPRRHTALNRTDLLYFIPPNQSLFYFVSSSVSDPGSGSEIQYHFAVSRSGSELFFPTEQA